MRLKLPYRPDLKPLRELPPELRWDGGTRAPVLAVLLSRRQFLKVAGVVLAALATPLTHVERAYARARGRFFTRHEFATLEALSDRIIPPDQDVGAKALGAARYIEGLLTAFDYPVPRLFAGGPFSGRTPFVNTTAGKPSGKRPPNSFRSFIPPTRLQALWWRAELFGSQGVSELAAIDAQLGAPLQGLRDVYRDSLKKVDDVAMASQGSLFTDLSPAEQDNVVGLLDAGAFASDPRRGGTFFDTLIRHTLEGCLAPPEYGGNRGRRGWKMMGLEGDDQPLGYSWYSKAKQDYNEDPRHPMSTPNPDEVGANGSVQPRPLSKDGADFQSLIAALSDPIGSACDDT